MNEAADKLRIEKLKDRITQVEGFIARNMELPDKPSTKLSLRSWKYELEELKKSLAEAIEWDSWTCAERVQWAEDQISELRGLIAGGIATPGTGLPPALNEPADSPKHFEFAKAGWENKIRDCEAVIQRESAKLA
jgi:hypothetical protein